MLYVVVHRRLRALRGNGTGHFEPFLLWLTAEPFTCGRSEPFVGRWDAMVVAAGLLSPSACCL